MLTNHSSIILNDDLDFKFNPFGGITIEELKQIIVPKKFFPDLKKAITSPTPSVIELVGKQGRGKTTHLNYLHQLFPQYPILHFTKKNKIITKSILNKKIIFLDSIHHLSFSKRIKVYKNFQKIILTTHQTRILEYKWARQNHQSFYFRGIDKNDLKTVIENRIQSALIQPTNSQIKINEKYLSQLLLNFKDDFRGILNHLYENFK